MLQRIAARVRAFFLLGRYSFSIPESVAPAASYGPSETPPTPLLNPVFCSIAPETPVTGPSEEKYTLVKR